MGLNTPLSVVVMAKPSRPGRVKTRLIGPSKGGLSAKQAALVHAEMARCVMQRLSATMDARFVLAMAEGPPAVAGDTGGGLFVPDGWRVTDQGAGDLGDRLTHVWRALGGGPVLFFGVDSPDVPATALAEAGRSLERPGVDAVVGPVDDGGYWVIGGRRLCPPLLAGIDWGSSRVYHQTLEASDRAGLRMHVLPGWHDVDEPADLAGLQQRLSRMAAPTAARFASDAALRRLAERLDRILDLRTDLAV